MTASPCSKWWVTATAQVLSDFRRDVWARDNPVRSGCRLAAVVCMVSVVVVLASLSYSSDRSLSNHTYIYRVMNVTKLPSGAGTLSSHCPCSKELLLWSAFLKWPRFADNRSRESVDRYCRQFGDSQARPGSALGVSTLDLDVAGDGDLNPGPPSSVPATQAGRRLQRDLAATSSVDAARNDVVQEVCSAWVQDIIATLDPSNLAYAADAYQAAQLKSEAAVRNVSKLWLGKKLNFHLQTQYRIATAARAQSGAASGTLPSTFRDFVVATQPQLDSVFLTAFAEIDKSMDYSKYQQLCDAKHCDVTATKPTYLYVIDGIAKMGGLWSNVLLVTIILWSCAAQLIPLLREPGLGYNEMK